MEPRTGTRCKVLCPIHLSRCEVVQAPKDLRELGGIMVGRQQTFAHDDHLCLSTGIPHTFKAKPTNGYCPDCGCSATLHNAVNKVGNELIAHCGACGACWRTAGTPFVDEVLRLLEAK